MKTTLFTILLIVFGLYASAQDTLKIMQYNLLNYNNYTSYCTTSNNNVDNKDGYLTTIIDYTLPDIFTVNEINETNVTLDRVLNNVMNASGRDYYARANRTNYANSDIINAMYYDTRKLALHSQDVVVTPLRDINLYHLYYLSNDLATGGDTAWVTCIVMHLKAGSYTEDEDDRAAEVSLLMNYLNALNKPGNYLAMGDFNVYSDDEECFQNLIAHPNANIRFNDPINKTGSWNNNSYYADYHTQSTHSVSNDCAASGGMDDRFDWILASTDIITGGDLVKYVPGSYYALAQDGDHFNSSLISSPTNTLVPSNVLNALYNNSDHLPVIMKLAIAKPVGIEEEQANFDFFVFRNDNNDLSAQVTATQVGRYYLRVFAADGRMISQQKINCTQGFNAINIEGVKANNQLLLIQLQSENGAALSTKTIY